MVFIFISCYKGMFYHHTIVWDPNNGEITMRKSVSFRKASCCYPHHITLQQVISPQESLPPCKNALKTFFHHMPVAHSRPALDEAGSDNEYSFRKFE